VIRRPLVTEKGVEKKDNERTLCFEVALDANKTQVKTAVEKLFKVKVTEVRTATFDGSCGAGTVRGLRSTWKKAYVKLRRARRRPISRRYRVGAGCPALTVRLQCRSRPTDQSPRAAVTTATTRDDLSKPARKVAGGSKEAHRRAQQHRPGDFAFIAGRQAAYRVVDFKRDKVAYRPWSRD